MEKLTQAEKEKFRKEVLAALPERHKDQVKTLTIGNLCSDESEEIEGISAAIEWEREQAYNIFPRRKIAEIIEAKGFELFYSFDDGNGKTKFLFVVENF